MGNGGIPGYYQSFAQNSINYNQNISTKINKPVLGTAQLGQVYGITNKEGLLTKKQSMEILETAWNKNIRIFDTAPSYYSEKIIGDFVKTNGLEKEITILTKISPVPILSDWKKHIIDSINNSILNLKCEAIDVLFFHNAENSVILSQYPDEFIEILKQFPINKIGVSVYEESEIDYFKNFNSFDIAFQFPYNIFDQRFTNNSIKEGNRYARSIFLQGIITSNKKLKNPIPYGLKKLHKAVHKYFQKHNINPLEYALQYIANSNQIDYYLFGVDNKNQLEEIMNIDLNNYHGTDSDFERVIQLIDKTWLDPRKWS
jgi:aryl-alcohol dehydrogenase-like predicted oxidoreductase